MGSMHFHCGALLFVSQWQCISSVISYSFLTVDYCSLCCARLVSQLHFVSVRGTNTLYDKPLLTSYRYCRHSQLHKICLFLKCLWFPWGQCRSIVVHCCLCHSDSASVLLNVPWCSIVGATVTVHQFFCILHSDLFFSFNLKISTHKAKK